MAKKSKNKVSLQTKKTYFQGSEVILYSIDGQIWSTRPDELQAIMDRHAAIAAQAAAKASGVEIEAEVKDTEKDREDKKSATKKEKGPPKRGKSAGPQKAKKPGKKK